MTNWVINLCYLSSSASPKHDVINRWVKEQFHNNSTSTYIGEACCVRWNDFWLLKHRHQHTEVNSTVKRCCAQHNHDLCRQWFCDWHRCYFQLSQLSKQVHQSSPKSMLDAIDSAAWQGYCWLTKQKQNLNTNNLKAKNCHQQIWN